VYTEILMWIERKIEGERPARMKLDAQPMNARKFRLKFIKHSLWLLVALWTGITFVGYFTPIKELLAKLLSFELGPWEAFWIFFYAAFLYLMAGFLREQVCKYMCPYARFQGVMFDPDTLIISYDPSVASRGAHCARRAPRRNRSRLVTAWTAASVCRSVRPVSTFATACSSNASPVRRASMPAIR
jgi:polyferredoxin